MGYAQREYAPPEPQTSEPPVTEAVARRHEAPWARRVVLMAVLLAIVGLGYQCALVRVSELDLAGQTAQDDCTKKEAELGRLSIRHAALVDGGQVEQIVQRESLQPPARRDQATVSAELIPGATVVPEHGEPQPPPDEVWAGLGAASGDW